MNGKDPKGVNCPAIDGLIEEAKDVAAEVEDTTVGDSAQIAAVRRSPLQKFNHF